MPLCERVHGVHGLRGPRACVQAKRIWRLASSRPRTGVSRCDASQTYQYLCVLHLGPTLSGVLHRRLTTRLVCYYSFDVRPSHVLLCSIAVCWRAPPQTNNRVNSLLRCRLSSRVRTERWHWCAVRARARRSQVHAGEGGGRSRQEWSRLRAALGLCTFTFCRTHRMRWKPHRTSKEH